MPRRACRTPRGSPVHFGRVPGSANVERSGVNVAAAGVGAGRRRRADSEVSRRRVLDAAVECILECGYYKTSTNEIARRAGVTWGTLQYQFGTRDALLVEVLNDRWETVQRAIADAEIVGATLEDRLGEMVEVLATHYGVPAHVAHLQIVIDLTHNPDTSDDIRRAVAAHGRELVRAWQPLVDRALGDAAQQEELVRYACAALRGYLIDHAILRSIDDIENDRVSRELLVRGVAAAIRGEAASRGITVA